MVNSNAAVGSLITRKQLVLLGFIFAVIMLVISLLLSGTAFASGAVGSGGSGSAGAGGSYASRNGYTWAAYDINGAGPSGGFRDGTAWGTVQSICRGSNAGSVSIYVLADDGSNSKDGSRMYRGYNYWQDWSVGKIANGSVIDSGRATAIPSSWARAAFDALPAASKFGYTFNTGSAGNVAWLCTGVDADPNPAGDSLFDCDRGFQGWALDANDLNARLGIAVLVRRTGTATWGTLATTTANQAIPNPPFDTTALARFGVNGNRGFTVALPGAYRDNLAYDYMVWAANAPGTPGAPVSNITLGGRVSFDRFRCSPPPQPWDVGVEVMCDIDRGTVTYTFSRNGTIRGNVNVIRNANFNNPNTPLLTNDTTTYNNSTWPTSPIVERFTPQVGQTLVASISVSPGNSGGTNSLPDTDTCPETGPKTAKPYFRTYGHDVVVGRHFTATDGTCSAAKSASKIEAFTRANGGNYVGSGSQFAASALGVIDGFMTAANHSGSSPGTTLPIEDLAFGNADSTASPGSKSATDLGSDTGAYAGCIGDYITYAEDPSSRFLTPSSNPVAAPNPIPTTAVDPTFSGPQRPIKYYYDGDITITGDITYSSDPQVSYNTQFINVIIVKGGNIRIAPSVSRIDALLVAVPDGPDTGQINTCSGTFQECVDAGTLTINGAVIANEIKLNRLNGDIDGPSTDPNELPVDTDIAEVFNYPAYMNFALMNIGSGATSDFSGLGEYESIVGLPPVL